jgi:hypothetical protein
MNPASEDTILQELFEQRKKLNESINKIILKKFQKYQGMSVEVKDDNPYRFTTIISDNFFKVYIK